ncbi:hypothetical protein KC366_g96 [Hortaea werneckii]|nr:hypothetical protein KC366_g96 [Hortaea werneckii]
MLQCFRGIEVPLRKKHGYPCGNHDILLDDSVLVITWHLCKKANPVDVVLFGDSRALQRGQGLPRQRKQLDRCRDGFRHLVAGHVQEINMRRLPILAMSASCDSTGRDINDHVNVAVLRCLYQSIRDCPVTQGNGPCAARSFGGRLTKKIKRVIGRRENMEALVGNIEVRVKTVRGQLLYNSEGFSFRMPVLGFLPIRMRTGSRREWAAISQDALEHLDKRPMRPLEKVGGNPLRIMRREPLSTRLQSISRYYGDD